MLLYTGQTPFLVRSCYATQVDLKLVVLLPLPPKHWAYRFDLNPVVGFCVQVKMPVLPEQGGYACPLNSATIRA